MDQEEPMNPSTRPVGDPIDLLSEVPAPAVEVGEVEVPGGLLVEGVWSWVGRGAGSPALVAGGRWWSYAEVWGRAMGVARELRSRGVGRGELVAVVMEKGWEPAVGVLGVQAAGAAYLPVDPGLPAERVRWMLEDGGVRWALTQSWWEEELTWPAGVGRVAVDALPWREADAEYPPGSEATAEDLAYVIYTSGSTGRPKGVMIEHRSARNTVLDVNQRLGLGPTDRVLGLSSLGFDLSVYDVFGTLSAGGALVLPEAGRERDPAHWWECLEHGGVTVWNSVPALMEMLVEWVEGRGEALPASLRWVLLSGDWIPVDLPDRIRAVSDGAVEVIGLGGATEASIWSVLHPIGAVDPQWKSIPYGRPMTHQRMHVLNDRRRPCPTWVRGELYIGGAGLARGYWRDPQRTAERFVPHPTTGERLYRTGDLGRWRPDGTIEFLGREDHQVKILGHRIELGEVEAALLRHPDVTACVVDAVGTGSRERRLVAYVVPRTPAPTPEALRQHLATLLPAPWLPSRYVPLDALPLTPNGKVDRNALPAPPTPPEHHGRPPRTGHAPGRALTHLVEEVLGVAPVHPDANLLDLGANSMDLLRVANRVAQELGSEPDLDAFFREPCVATLVRLHAQSPSREPDATTVRVDETIPAAASASALLDALEERDALKRSQPGRRRDLEGRMALSLTAPQGAPREPETSPGPTAWRSHRRFLREPFPVARLASLLEPLRQHPQADALRYRYPSAGGLYPVQLHVYAKPGRIDGLPGGTYYYDPAGHRLLQIDGAAVLTRDHHALINRHLFDQAAFSLFFVLEEAAMVPFYGERTRDYALYEAGAMGQLLRIRAPRAGLGLCDTGGIDPEELRAALALRSTQPVLHGMLGGAAAPDGEGPRGGADGPGTS